ncbi:MAG: cytochrome C oxidase subunit IV family protein [Pyrinomonadaceae bacterium]|jgi:cytochrome c oxidase subunit 4|nr:cytochrome C oxidase subunit IV family protein [Chloracidobacterium sp.]MBP7415017.1 cytochrome C oxidase subunit IV family protein [Pyrinomonadaceae bacterium]
MADTHNEHDHEHMNIPKYIGIFMILVVGTIATYFAATVDMDRFFPGANTLVALLIAFTKMTFVMLFFMHVYWSKRLIWLAAVGSFFWLAIMFAYTMQDYLTRGSGTFSG